MSVPLSFLKFLDWFPNQRFAFVACAVFIIGLLVGRAMMSIGMIALLASALLNLDYKENYLSLIKNKSALLLTSVFILFAITFFWSDNTAYFFSRIQVMLPFLVMPFAFQAIRWSTKLFDYLLMLLIAVVVMGSIWSLAQYGADMEAINASYGLSKSMPTPFMNDHIRFGIAVVVGISFCFQFIKKGDVKWLWVVAAVFLIIYLHVLASKTALLALYLIVLFEIIQLIINKKKIVLGLSFLAILLLAPIFFFYTSDTFRTKMYYTQYAFKEMMNADLQINVSDEGRIISYQTALSILKEKWLLGVGIGDGQDEIKKLYIERGISSEKILYPHNQFLYVALVSGVLGLLYFLWVTFGIVFYNYKKSDWLSSFLLIFLVPLSVEAFFNTQYGVAIFLFFFLLLERKTVLHSNIDVASEKVFYD